MATHGVADVIKTFGYDCSHCAPVPAATTARSTQREPLDHPQWRSHGSIEPGTQVPGDSIDDTNQSREATTEFVQPSRPSPGRNHSTYPMARTTGPSTPKPIKSHGRATEIYLKHPARESRKRYHPLASCVIKASKTSPPPFSEVAHVNAPLTEKEFKEVRWAVRRGNPFGEETWGESHAQRLDLESTLRPRGRPRNLPSNPNKIEK